MLTTSPACSARHTSSRIVRTSRRTISPFREISPDAGLTFQSPTRSGVMAGVREYTNTISVRLPPAAGLSELFRSFQREARIFSEGALVPVRRAGEDTDADCIGNRMWARDAWRDRL